MDQEKLDLLNKLAGGAQGTADDDSDFVVVDKEPDSMAIDDKNTASGTASSDTKGDHNLGAMSESVPSKLTMSMEAAYKDYAFSDSVRSNILVTLAAPEIDAEAKRTPLDIVAVIDRSGSMGMDNKMNLMKRTLEFMVSQLSKDDRLAVVSFDRAVRTDAGLTKMNEKEKLSVLGAINRLKPGTTTNLSGGLFQGMHIIRSRPDHEVATRTASVILFTDGIANCGVTKTPDLVKGLGMEANARTDGKVTVCTFGYGDDHDDEMLRALAESGKGSYYYLQDVEKIPDAFGDALGGLLSVAAQNISITVRGVNEAKVDNVHTPYPTTYGDNSVSIEIGDIYSEEKKNIMIPVHIPRLSAPLDGERTYFAAEMSYYNISSSSQITTAHTLELRRSREADYSSPNVQVETQRVRFEYIDLMDKVRKATESGKNKEADEMISRVNADWAKSPAHNTPLMRQFVSETKAVQRAVSDTAKWSQYGRKLMNTRATMHTYERGSSVVDVCGVDIDNSPQYESSAKRRMKGSLKKALS